MKLKSRVSLIQLLTADLMDTMDKADKDGIEAVGKSGIKRRIMMLREALMKLMKEL